MKWIENETFLPSCYLSTRQHTLRLSSTGMCPFRFVFHAPSARRTGFPLGTGLILSDVLSKYRFQSHEVDHSKSNYIFDLKNEWVRNSAMKAV
jgi:hypothetical protein